MSKFVPVPQSSASKFATIAGIRTHYLEEGRGEPVVLIHGGGPGADGWGNWHSCLPLLAQQLRPIAMDMVGFGRSDKPDPSKFAYSQAARIEHLIAFIQELDLGPVSLVGNSMGGSTALGVAISRPDLVRKIVLMGSAGLMTKEFPKALTPLVQYDGTAAAMKNVIRALTHPGYEIDEAMLEYRVAASKAPGAMQALKATVASGMNNGLAYSDEAIRSIRVPTLVVGGKLDPISPISNAYRFLELLDNSWGYLLPHTGHWVMIERPAEFSAVCRTFLAS